MLNVILLKGHEHALNVICFYDQTKVQNTVNTYIYIYIYIYDVYVLFSKIMSSA
jgi:hypothetical protein